MRSLPTSGAGRRPYFALLNRNKRSITLDLRSPEAAGVPSSLVFTGGASVDPGDYTVKIAVADGDRSVLVREVNGKQTSYRVRLDSLIRDGDINANVDMQPGDILIIPQRYF